MPPLPVAVAWYVRDIHQKRSHIKLPKIRQFGPFSSSARSQHYCIYKLSMTATRLVNSSESKLCMRRMGRMGLFTFTSLGFWKMGKTFDKVGRKWICLVPPRTIPLGFPTDSFFIVKINYWHECFINDVCCIRSCCTEHFIDCTTGRNSHEFKLA